MLLRRFAHDGRLWHLSIEREEQLRLTGPRDMGHVNNGHTIVTHEGERDRASLEHKMSKIEGAASAAIAALENNKGIAVVPPELAEPIAWLASLQEARSRVWLGYVAAQAGLSKDDDPFKGTIGEVQSMLLRVGTMGVLDAWSLRDDDSVRPKDRWDFVAHTLLEMRWEVMRYPDPCLAVSDAFAAQYGIREDLPGVPGAFEPNPQLAEFGLNTPLWAADGLTIALTPVLALSLHRDATARSVSAADVNMHTIRSARSFLAFPSNFEPSNVIPGWSDWIAEAKAIRQALPKAL
jgi:hypothetical protein